MRTFTEPDDLVSRFTTQLESALLARALAESGSLPDERTKALLALWCSATFNASMLALPNHPGERGLLAWESRMPTATVSSGTCPWVSPVRWRGSIPRPTALGRQSSLPV